jgi:hypothetical protein
MIRHRSPQEVLEDLRFALEVMEENSHLGLEKPAADNLRGRILAQIAQVEAAIGGESARPTRSDSPVFEVPE